MLKIKTDVSEINKQELVNFSYNSSQDLEYQKKNRNQWRKVLGTFDLIKGKTLVSKTKPEQKSIRKIKTIQRPRKVTSFRKKTSERRSTLSSSFTNTINESNCSQPNLDDSEIVWSSSNEESDSGLGIAVLNKRTDVSRCKGHLKCHHETEIGWSSSNESENEENLPLKKKTDIIRYTNYLKRKHVETAIDWSSSNESENEGSLTQKKLLCDFPKQADSEYELNSFVREIEKDLRRTKQIKQKLTIKKGGYLGSFRKAVHKAKADTGFLEYEQRAEIICGFKGVINEKKVSYGSCLANVRLESGSNCYLFLGKTMHSSNNGSTLVCFLDNSHYYTVNDRNIYIQPNKVITC